MCVLVIKYSVHTKFGLLALSLSLRLARLSIGSFNSYDFPISPYNLVLCLFSISKLCCLEFVFIIFVASYPFTSVCFIYLFYQFTAWGWGISQ